MRAGRTPPPYRRARLRSGANSSGSVLATSAGVGQVHRDTAVATPHRVFGGVFAPCTSSGR